MAKQCPAPSLWALVDSRKAPGPELTEWGPRCPLILRSSELERTSQPTQVKHEEAEAKVGGWGGEKLAHAPIAQLAPWADTTASEVEVQALEPGSPAVCFGQVT